MSGSATNEPVELTREALKYYAPGPADTAAIRSFADWNGKIAVTDADIIEAAGELVAAGFAVVTSRGWQIATAAS